MAMVDGAPIPPNAQAKANGIVKSDTAEGRVPVHNFNSDAPPEEKAAAASKDKQQLGLEDKDIETGAQGMFRPSQIPPPSASHHRTCRRTHRSPMRRRGLDRHGSWE